MADDDEDQTVVDAPSSKPAMPAFFAALHEPPSVPAAPSQVAGDVDPLDAFMSGIRETKQDELRVAVAATMHASHSRRLQDDDDAPGGGAVAALLPGGAAASDAPSPAEELGEEAAAAGAAAVITFEEVLRLAKGGVGAGAGAVDRAKEEASHASFLQAFRAQNAEEERLLALAQEREAAEAAAAVDKDLFADAAEVGRGGVAAGELIHLEDDGGHEAVLAGERTGPSGLELLRERANKKELKAVDHSQIEYAAFRKELYVESPEVSEQSAEAVEAICESLEIRVRGAKPFPAPVSAWVHCGLSSRVMEVISRAGWAAPFAIQRQALPIIMSGRDMIGVAKTGSGKTLAFVLPMFRHVMDQPPVRAGEGPVALLLAPARELAVQIHDVVCTFTKPLGLTTVCCYGGATVKDQIMQIRRGAAVLVATPGRLIDLLSAGRLLSLTRVTYVVLDEADRMFDMGFEPQVMRIINNTRPDRQIVLFSATFPPLVERVARDVLRCKPVVVVVGGRTKASSDIAQFVEVREPQDKFPRLLQLLGDWYEVGGVLVFVKSQDACDKLFMQLMQAGYRALTLHGGKDQADRDFAFQDFKAGRQTLMVATSVAGRGLDVAALRLVVNYDVPNHLEDYIHRIGRTGRAGNKGTAYTFISSEEDSYAPDLVKALKDANQSVPAELETLARRFQDKIEKGEAHFRSSGYRGHGFTFKEGETTELGKQQELLRKQQQASLGLGKPDEHKQEQDETDGDGIVAVSANTGKTTTVTPTAGASSSNSSSSSSNHSNGNKIAAAQAHPPPPEGQAAAAALAKVRSLAGKFAQPTSAGEHGHSSGRAGHKPVYFAKEVVINDYPKDVRIKISHVDTLNRIHELTACAAVPKGVFVPPGRRANAGERPMYILIEGSTEYDVARAANEVNRILEEATQDVAMREAKKGSAAPGRYSVV